MAEFVVGPVTLELLIELDARRTEVLVRFNVDEFAEELQQDIEQKSAPDHRRTYGDDDGLQTLPKCTSIPPGPQPTRNDRPKASPASTKEPSWPLAIDVALSTLAYFRDGRYVGGST